ncbi:TRAP transporter small permease subunit [Pararhodobacter sp.]|uniref:TRAP transporter small permease subunit n=1 Tax=Pararhodobacter sp. TaxID=2127056 RepID=UPI001D64A409|nr:TRAP transporter small permease subunit [Pararhodobacter sp.]MCB1345981.1 TRAP transporter small permease subunit [Paracoccaceae bacterium]
MTASFLRIARMLDRATLALCMAAGGVLVLMVLVNVVLRYGFGAGSIKMQDLASYAFAVFLILSVPVCHARGGHVRVEVVSERLPATYLPRADAVAWLLFLAPVFALIVWAGWGDVLFAWSIREGSTTPGGLGGLFLVKTALPVAAALMVVQGLAAVLRAGRA